MKNLQIVLTTYMYIHAIADLFSRAVYVMSAGNKRELTLASFPNLLSVCNNSNARKCKAGRPVIIHHGSGGTWGRRGGGEGPINVCTLSLKASQE